MYESDGINEAVTLPLSLFQNEREEQKHKNVLNGATRYQPLADGMPNTIQT